jgi:uncharacterized protein (TIGR02598 family)
MNESHMTAQDDLPGWRAEFVRRRFIRRALLPTSLIPSGFLRVSGTARPVVRLFAAADVKLSHLRQAAFSLVEVALALGVVSFSLMALIGLVPVGLGHFRDAIDATVGSQIAQRVVTDAQQTDFDLLNAKATTATSDFFVLPIRYFDEQGSEILPGAADAANQAIYQVRVRGSQPGPADSNASGCAFTSLPAAPGAERFRPRDSVFLTVQIARRPGLMALPVDEERQLWKAGAAPMSSYRMVITRNGYTPTKS